MFVFDDFGGEAVGEDEGFHQAGQVGVEVG